MTSENHAIVTYNEDGEREYREVDRETYEQLVSAGKHLHPSRRLGATQEDT